MSRRVGQGYMVACRHCGGLANPRFVSRARESFIESLPSAFVYPFSRNGFTTMAACGVIFGLLYSLGPMAMLVSFAAWTSYLFMVIRQSADGHEDVPESEDFSNVFDLFISLLKAALAMVLSVAPFALYTFYLKPKIGLTIPTLLDPLTYLTAAMGLSWTPIAIMLAALDSPFISVVHPVLAWDCIRRLGRVYVLASLVFWGTVAGWAVLNGTGHLFVILLNRVPAVPRMIAEAISLYPGLAGARVLGQFLFIHGGDIGVGHARDELEPALGDAMPPEEASTPSSWLPPETAIEPSPEFLASITPVTLQAAAPVAIELPPDETPATYEESSPSDDEIRTWADMKQFAAVAVAYRERRGAVTILSADELVQTGRAALAQQDWQTAAHAFKRIGSDHADSRNAPQALLLSARLMREKLDRVDEGDKLLSRLIRTYPATKEAEKARQLLAGAA